jgi:hypothetical protein
MPPATTTTTAAAAAATKAQEKITPLWDAGVVVAVVVVAGTLFANRDASQWIVPATVVVAFTGVLFLSQTDTGKGDMTMLTRRVSIACLGIWSLWIVLGVVVPYSTPKLGLASWLVCALAIWVAVDRRPETERPKVRVVMFFVVVLSLVPVRASKDMSPVELIVHTAAYVFSYYGMLYARIRMNRPVTISHMVCSNIWLLCTPLFPFAAGYVVQVGYVAYIVQRSLSIVAATTATAIADPEATPVQQVAGPVTRRSVRSRADAQSFLPPPPPLPQPPSSSRRDHSEPAPSRTVDLPSSANHPLVQPRSSTPENVNVSLADWDT